MYRLLHETPALLLACLLTLNLTGFVRAEAADAPAASPNQKDLDQQVRNALRSIHDQGKQLYDTGATTECYWLFQGALLTVKPMLAAHPDLQKTIDAGLADAAGRTKPERQAFVLHDLIEKVRAQLKNADQEK